MGLLTSPSFPAIITNSYFGRDGTVFTVKLDISVRKGPYYVMCFEGLSPGPDAHHDSSSWFKGISGVDFMQSGASCPVRFEINEASGRVSDLILRFPNWSAWNATNLDTLSAGDVYNLYTNGIDLQLIIKTNMNESRRLEFRMKGSHVADQDINIEVQFEINHPALTFKIPHWRSIQSRSLDMQTRF